MLAVASVCPYASGIGHPNIALESIMTSSEIGAEPVAIRLTCPPKLFLILLNISLS